MKKILFISKVAAKSFRADVDNFDGSIVEIDNTRDMIGQTRAAKMMQDLGIDKLPAVVLIPTGQQQSLELIRSHHR